MEGEVTFTKMFIQYKQHKMKIHCTTYGGDVSVSHTELTLISPGTPEWPPPRSVSSPPLHMQRSLQSHWWDANRRGSVCVRERKQKATGEEEKQANKRTYKLQMIVQNTHYLSIASLLPSGTRSGNSQNKKREGDEQLFRSKSTPGSWKRVHNLVIKKQQI